MSDSKPVYVTQPHLPALDEFIPYLQQIWDNKILTSQPDYPLSRDGLYARLSEHNIYARRYFYPLISEFPMYRGLPSAHRENLPVASRVAQQVLCLPIYPALSREDQLRVVELIAEA